MGFEVCIVTSGHRPDDTRVFQKQARGLARVGYSVAFLVPHDRDEQLEGVHIKPLRKRRGPLGRVITAVSILKAAVRERADVYHFHDLDLVPVAVLLKLVTRKKVIYDVHEDNPKLIEGKKWRPALLKQLAARFIGWGERSAARFCFDIVVTAGEDIAPYFDGKKTITLQNYPLISAMPSVVEKKEDRETYTLVYCGGISPLRGVAEVIQALEVLDRPDVRLLLIGRFGDIAYAEQVQSMRGFRYVDYRGWMGQHDLYETLAGCDIAIYCPRPAPNYLNLRSNKIFEFMAAGLPIITAHFPSWKKIVEGEGVGITVDPQDIEQISESIRYLVENPDLRETMGNRGREAVLTRYNWESEERKLLEAYENIAGRLSDAKGHNSAIR